MLNNYNINISIIIFIIIFTIFLFNYYKYSMLHIFIFTEIISSIYISILIIGGVSYGMSFISWIFLVLLGIIGAKASTIISIIILNIQWKNNINNKW